MESYNILMSHVHISIHITSTVDGGQSVNHLPLFRKNWLWDPLQLVLSYTTSKNQESYHDRLSREVSQRKVEHDLTPSWIWQILNLETSFIGKPLSSSWTVPSCVDSPEPRGDWITSCFGRASTWRSLKEPGKKFCNLDSLDSEFMGVWYFYNFLPVLRVNSSWIACF